MKERKPNLIHLHTYKQQKPYKELFQLPLRGVRTIIWWMFPAVCALQVRGFAAGLEPSEGLQRRREAGVKTDTAQRGWEPVQWSERSTKEGF